LKIILISENQILKFITFNQGNSIGLGKAPHKPILLLAVIKAIENNVISENKIYITPELVSYFKSYWDQLVFTGHTSNFSLPFFHLKNEKSKLWTLKNKPGYEFALTSSNSIRSFKALNDATDYAHLDDGFYQLLKEKKYRDFVRSLIMHKYFPNEELSDDGKGDYLRKIENEIVSDSSTDYVLRVKKLIKQDDAEEEIYLRGAAFKKQIPRIYDYTCAITGMKVVAISDISLIDACHIIPFKESFDDTIHNGISLCPNMHRAFDRGIISIDANYRVLVSDKFIENHSSHSIRQFEGKEIKLPQTSKLYPSQSNLENHRRRFNFN